MEEKSVLVTGATSGIGKAIAVGLAEMNMSVIVGARNPEKGKKIVKEIKQKTLNPKVHLGMGDLSTKDGINQLVDSCLSTFEKLDVLINNAAIIPRKRILTSNGLETQFAVNHLAPYILTAKLLPALMKGNGGRIVNVGAGLYRIGKIDFNNLQGEKTYRRGGWEQYANTKLMNMVCTFELARRLEGTNIVINTLHPGVIRTSLGRGNILFNIGKPFLSSPVKGARTPIYLATSDEVEGITGKYFISKKEVGTAPVLHDTELAEKLWDVTEQITEVNYHL